METRSSGGCVYALTAEQAEKAQRGARKKKRKKQERLGPRAMESAKYVMVFTTVPSHRMTTTQVLATYRLRWGKRSGGRQEVAPC
jgi:hypothetical protein